MDFLWSSKAPFLITIFDLKFFLEGLFGCSVDLVIKDTIKQRIRFTIPNEYFGVKLETVWTVMEEKVPALEEQTKTIHGEET